MRALELMADVLPPPGNGLYCIAELSSARKQHIFVERLEEIKPHVQRWNTKNYDIYFALATFDERVLDKATQRRTAINAQRIKSIFIDIDGYETKAEAGAALYAFLEQTGLDTLGLPHVLSSGGGLHCYWPLTTPVTITAWRPVAENFKRLCKQEGMSIDMSVTADAARVLRVPGTWNHKRVYPEPRQVKLLRQGTGPVALNDFSAAVRGCLTEAFSSVSTGLMPAEAALLDGAPPTKVGQQRAAMLEAMLGNRTQRFQTIWLKTRQGEGCAQLAHYEKHASEDGMEPLWRGVLSWAHFCVDADEQTRKLTALHPYSIERMNTKLAEIRGPYSCAKIDDINPGVCRQCPHWGKITNPLALGKEVLTENRERTIIVPANTFIVADEPGEHSDDGLNDEDGTPDILQTRRVTIPPPPRGFSYGKFGGVYVDLKEKDASGTTVVTKVEVLAHDLFVVDMLRTEDGEHKVHLLAIKPTGTDSNKELTHISIIMPSKAVVSKEDLLKCLASHNIYASLGASMDQYLFSYVRSCVNEASMLRKAVEVPVQFGWQKDRSFVYNNRVFKPDGSFVVVPMPGLENLNRVTNAKGTLDNWRKPWQLLIAREMDTMLAMCLDSFGSTLMHFSNHEGFVWHIGSTASGTGKSLTLSLKAGVWGHPIRYRTSKGTSPVAMQQRAGLLNSLPLLSDEITTKARNDVEWAPAFIFDFAEGQGKERMEASANKERINNSTWASTCTLTSNVHMVDLLTGSRKHSSHGEMMRMLEWSPETELRFSEEERVVLQALRSNYGLPGEAWVRWTVSNYEKTASVWNSVHAKLRAELSFSDEERLWHAACTNIIAAAILLGEKYANILDVPVARIVAALHKIVARARRAYKASVRSAEDILNAYIRENHGRFVVVRRDVDGELKTELGLDLASKTSTRTVVMGRVEHDTRNAQYVEFFVEENMLKQHCAAMSFGYSDLKRGLEGLKQEGFSARFGARKDMLARVDGPSLRVNVMHLSIPKARIDEESSTLSLA